jgi:26S proteasome non-ATPase regulatory subunit 9
MGKKQRIEEEISMLTEVLESTPAGVSGPLVDREGFPRADCDLWMVRTNRKSRICLTNDQKAIMKEIDQYLKLLHEAQRREGLVQEHSAATATVGEKAKPEMSAREKLAADCKRLPGLLKVESVTAQSPASIAGLQVGDEVVSFQGVVKSQKGNTLATVAETVKDHVGKRMQIVVRREGQMLVLDLTPNHWHGPGLLGCKIVQI